MHPSRGPDSEPQRYLLLTEVSSEPICSNKLGPEHRRWVPPDSNRETRIPDFFVGLVLGPLWSAVSLAALELHEQQRKEGYYEAQGASCTSENEPTGREFCKLLDFC